MFDDTRQKLTLRLQRDYGLKRQGEYLRGGKCPHCCDKKSLWTPADHPWVLRCGRLECGYEGETKALYATQKALKHRSIKTTLRYAHALHEDVAAPTMQQTPGIVPDQNARKRKGRAISAYSPSIATSV